MRTMHPYILLMLCALFGTAFRSHGESLPAVTQSAQTAYDEGQFKEAIRHYHALLDKGVQLPEVHYNLGNAYYRAGMLPDAIRHYRKASYLAPRDPDIRHNLLFTLEQADALASKSHVPWNWFSRISLNEWVVLATLSWWFTALYAALAIWRRQGSWIRPLTLSAILCVIAGLGCAYWLHLQRYPEVVIMKAGQEALFAPLDGATAHFSLPAGSIARVESERTAWYRVSVGEQSGWIRKSVSRPVQ